MHNCFIVATIIFYLVAPMTKVFNTLDHFHQSVILAGVFCINQISCSKATIPNKSGINFQWWKEREWDERTGVSLSFWLGEEFYFYELVNVLFQYTY